MCKCPLLHFLSSLVGNEYYHDAQLTAVLFCIDIIAHIAFEVANPAKLEKTGNCQPCEHEACMPLAGGVACSVHDQHPAASLSGARLDRFT